MILRRLSQHLREQNWIAIEFVLLVAGVYLGIQVSNWNAERELNRKSVEFSARLKADLRLEAWSYTRLIAYNRAVAVAAEHAVGALEGKYELSDESLLISAYRATQYVSHFRNNATYEELTSTGAMGLIRDMKLRELVVSLNRDILNGLRYYVEDMP